MLFYSSCKVMFAIVLWQMAAIAITTHSLIFFHGIFFITFNQRKPVLFFLAQTRKRAHHQVDVFVFKFLNDVQIGFLRSGHT